MPTFCRRRQTNRSYSFSFSCWAFFGPCLGALAMPDAHAQTIHQLAYNNSTWIDQSLFGREDSPGHRSRRLRHCSQRPDSHLLI